MMPTPLTLDDLPHFAVSAARKGETRESGETDYQLSGTFDRTNDVSEGECSLLLPQGEVLIALTGNLRFVEISAGTALYETAEQSMPEVIGLKLTYLDRRWEPYHVWMVGEPRWKWNKVLFQAVDATARKVVGDGVSVVDGQDVKEWIEIKRMENPGTLSRYYPIFPNGRINLPPIGPDGIVKGGWDHVHCELCDSHIDAGEYGYVDLGEHWMCETCFERYVVSHDLSFLKT